MFGEALSLRRCVAPLLLTQYYRVAFEVVRNPQVLECRKYDNQQKHCHYDTEYCKKGSVIFCVSDFFRPGWNTDFFLFDFPVRVLLFELFELGVFLFGEVRI